MWYSTSYTWELLFNENISIQEIREVQKYLWENINSHPEWWYKWKWYLWFIDLCINDTMTWLEWRVSEKSSLMQDKVNFLIKKIREKFPHFTLSWGFLCQGENLLDRYRLMMSQWIKMERFDINVPEEDRRRIEYLEKNILLLEQDIAYLKDVVDSCTTDVFND